MKKFEISLASSGLRLHLPAGHSIIVPTTSDGVKTIRRILREHGATPDAKIGTDASPTQWQVERWLEADRAAKEKKIIESVELNGLDLELTL